jgi:hypothetical protein
MECARRSPAQLPEERNLDRSSHGRHAILCASGGHMHWRTSRSRRSARHPPSKGCLPASRRGSRPDERRSPFWITDAMSRRSNRPWLAPSSCIHRCGRACQMARSPSLRHRPMKHGLVSRRCFIPSRQFNPEFIRPPRSTRMPELMNPPRSVLTQSMKLVPRSVLAAGLIVPVHRRRRRRGPRPPHRRPCQS